MPPTPLPLKDIHLPESIGWYPPAMGWWLLAIGLPLLVAFFYWLYKRLVRKSAIKTATKILVDLKQDVNKDNFQKLCELSILLRRAAISIFPRSEVASLTGQAWLDFLDRSMSGKPFSEGVGACLADAPYRKSTVNDIEMTELLSLCESWLKAQTRQKTH
jgi:hypothetical protein